MHCADIGPALALVSCTLCCTSGCSGNVCGRGNLQGWALALQLPVWVLSTADIIFMFERLCASAATCAATSVDLCVESELQGMSLLQCQQAA